MRRAGRIAARLFLAFPLMLLVALLFGALIPRNPGWREPAQGIPIGIDASLAHGELVLPVSAAGHDWRLVLPPGSVPPGTTHLSFSWGERAFFLATPCWSDLDVRLGLRALFASGDSLVHIYRLEQPWGRPVRMTPAQYRRLVAYLESEIAPDRPALPGYGASDIFVPGTGRYSWRLTCNDWVADGLAAAGVRVGLWTPFAQGLIWRFERQQGEDLP